MFSHVFDYKASVVLSAARRVIEKSGQEAVESGPALEQELVKTNKLVDELGTWPVARAVMSGSVPGQAPAPDAHRKTAPNRKGSFVAVPEETGKSPDVARKSGPAARKTEVDEKREAAAAEAPKSVTRSAAQKSSRQAAEAVAKARAKFDEKASSTANPPQTPKTSRGGMHVDASYAKKAAKSAAGETSVKKKAPTGKPSREELVDALVAEPYTKVAERYGVSATTLRRWAAGYGLPTKRAAS